LARAAGSQIDPACPLSEDDGVRAWFRGLLAAAGPDEYSRKVADVADEFDGHNRARPLATARRAAMPAPRAAVRVLDAPRMPADAARRRTARDRSRG
jgi:hypothetical protein